MTQGIARVLWVLCVVALFAAAGCGGDDESTPPPLTDAGAVAEFVPADADLYFEAVVRPGDDLREQLDVALETFGGDDFDATEDFEEFLDSEVGSLPLDDPEAGLDYESDIQPWLGDRVGGFLTLPADLSDLAEADEIAPDTDAILDGAIVFSVTDTDAAESAIERLAGESAVETPRALVYVPATEPLFGHDVALADGALVVGDPQAVEAALAAVDGSDLSDEPWFEEGLASVSDQAFGFFLSPTEELFRAQMAREAPRFADRYGDEIIERLGYDREAPVVAEVEVVDGAVALDTTYGLDRRAPLAAATRLARRLPAEAFLGFSDPALLPALIREFTFGIEIGLRRQGPAVIRNLGYDPALASSLLGSPIALFASGDSPADLVVGASVSAQRPLGATHAIDGVRFALGAAFSGLIKPLGQNPYEFSAEFEGLPGLIDVTEDSNTVNLVMGPTAEARKAALRGTKPLGQSAEWNEIERRLGDDFSPLGFVDIAPTLEVLSAVPGAIPLGTELPDEVEDLRLDLGGDVAGKTMTLRYLLSNEAE